MSFWWRRVSAVFGVGVAAAVWLVAVPAQPIPVAAPGSQSQEPDLGTILLDGRDVPPAFELDSTGSGYYEEPPTGPSWLSPITAGAAGIRGYDRVWYHRKERRAIIAQVIEYPIERLAAADVHSFLVERRASGWTEFSIVAVPHAHGFVGKEGQGGVPAVHAIFVQGPRAFSIGVLTRGEISEADVELARRLVEIQAGKAPPGSTELRGIGKLSLAAGTALATLGAAVVYTGGLSLIAWLRDPLRGHPTQPALQTTTSSTTKITGTVVDVTARARRRRRQAAVGLLLELGGAGVVVAGLLPFTWPLGLLLVVLGLGIFWLPRLLTPTARRAEPQPQLWTGRRRLRVVGYAAISTVCVLTGLLTLILYGVGAVLTSPGYDYNIRIVSAGVVLLVTGTLLRRRAHRVAALDATEVLWRDPRPMVLYLRTFADDSLTIRTASYGRRSFVDRLSPRRFERFEEVLVRHLTANGPVVALNPPGTDLAPIGAARETLEADSWQVTIQGWMTEARLIVVGAAPEAVTPGFGWELRTVDSLGLWAKTLLVLPPVPDAALRKRWEQFATVFSDTAMGHHPVPADPGRTLALVGSPAAGWSAVTAEQRTEWTYATALVAAAAVMASAHTTLHPGTDS